MNIELDGEQVRVIKSPLFVILKCDTDPESEDTHALAIFTQDKEFIASAPINIKEVDAKKFKVIDSGSVLKYLVVKGEEKE